MKVLILSANTGQGHNSCAKALKEVYENHGSSCEIQDALAFISPGFSRFICRWFIRIYRYCPRAFRWGYRVSETHPEVFAEGSFLYKIYRRGSVKLASYVKEGGFDTVICTHVFAAMILNAAPGLDKISIKTASVATDYTASPSVEQGNPDIQFIPDKSLESEFLVGNLTKEKIYPSGIPVREDFFVRLEKSAAKARMGIKEGHKHLLIMCGSMGCGHLKRLASRLKEALKEGQEATLICGTNKKLYRRLKRKNKDGSKLHICGYTNEISLYMDSADLYLTKPGGISVTEAAVKNLPMVFMDAVGGCEDHNSAFFTKTGGAVTANGPEELSKTCVSLLSDDERLSAMSNALKGLVCSNPAETIYSVMAKN